MGRFEFVVSKGQRRGTARGFPSSRFLVGTGPSCAFRLDEAGVAAEHVEVWLDAAGVPNARDVSGRADLLVDGVPTAEATLSPGCFLAFGQVELVLRELQHAAGPSGTLARPGVTPARTGRQGATPSRAPAGSGVKRPTGPGPLVAEEFSDSAGTLDATVRSTVLPPGAVVDGRYEIVGKIAEGGMGEVYRAVHVELGKTLALKVMRPELSADPEFVSRFKREAVAASQIGQQNIIDVSDFGRTSAGRFYFVMEHVDGQTLEELIREGGALPPRRAVHLVTQVARALEASHAKGIIHRDLKPENVMVLQRPGQPDFVKVLDFGVAKVSARKNQPGQTAVGMVVGTPQYMAPEQAQASAVDARSDVYALGLILYELLSGVPTFTAETPSMLMVKHVTEPPPPFSDDVRARVPGALHALVFRMLEKSPDARPQGMGEVCEALSNAFAADVPAARPASARTARTTVSTTPVPARQEVEKNPSRKPVWVGAGVALVVAGAAAAWLMPGAEQPRHKDTLPGAVQIARAPASAPIVAPVPAVVPVAAPVPPSPALVQVKFTSTAEPLRVFEKDIALGITPVTLERPRGTVLELTFRGDGYKDGQLKVRFESLQEVPVSLERTKIQAGAVRAPRSPSPVQERAPEELKDNPY